LSSVQEVVAHLSLEIIHNKQLRSADLTAFAALQSKILIPGPHNRSLPYTTSVRSCHNSLLYFADRQGQFSTRPFRRSSEIKKKGTG
jgi:hypothetical protein